MNQIIITPKEHIGTTDDPNCNTISNYHCFEFQPDQPEKTTKISQISNLVAILYNLGKITIHTRVKGLIKGGLSSELDYD